MEYLAKYLQSCGIVVKIAPISEKQTAKFPPKQTPTRQEPPKRFDPFAVPTKEELDNGEWRRKFAAYIRAKYGSIVGDHGRAKLQESQENSGNRIIIRGERGMHVGGSTRKSDWWVEITVQSNISVADEIVIRESYYDGAAYRDGSTVIYNGIFSDGDFNYWPKEKLIIKKRSDACWRAAIEDFFRKFNRFIGVNDKSIQFDWNDEGFLEDYESNSSYLSILLETFKSPSDKSGQDKIIVAWTYNTNDTVALDEALKLYTARKGIQNYNVVRIKETDEPPKVDRGYGYPMQRSYDLAITPFSYGFKNFENKYSDEDRVIGGSPKKVRKSYATGAGWTNNPLTKNPGGKKQREHGVRKTKN